MFVSHCFQVQTSHLSCFCSRVPADCRVVDSVELLLDESSLTGENQPVSKTGEGLSISSASPALTAQLNMVFTGTLVNSGRGRAVVVAVGEHTEFGKVAAELSSMTARKSPLQLKIDELGQRLAATSSLVIVGIAILGWLWGRPFLETVTVAVSLAVAAIPEGLPICVTVTLALGVLRMARSNAIVKKLTAVESLGCATAVASDKTGTLTQNEMTVRRLYSPVWPETNIGFTGVGYSTTNGNMVYSDSERPNYSMDDSSIRGSTVTSGSPEMPALQVLLQVACLCNNATLHQSDGDDKKCHSGQPTELALLVAAAKAGVEDPRPQYHRLQEVPFSSERKRMEVRARPVNGVHASQPLVAASQDYGSNGDLYFVKGMPEMIIGECIGVLAQDGKPQPLSEEQSTSIIIQSRNLASTGLRVLAMAYGPSLETLTFAGLVAMEDPPRAGVARSVRQLRSGGVKVMMVTGDSKETAIAVAKRCNILGKVFEDDCVPDEEYIELGTSEAMSGEEIDDILSENLPESIEGVKVFYRVVPRHKLAIVRACKIQRVVVTYLFNVHSNSRFVSSSQCNHKEKSSP